MTTARFNNNVCLASYYVVTSDAKLKKELSTIVANFPGTVYQDDNSIHIQGKNTLYLCGDIGRFYATVNISDLRQVKVVKELSYNYQESEFNNDASRELIGIGQVPLDMFRGVGLYFREIFQSQSSACLDKGQSYFDKLVKSHEFQTLTEGNKSGSSFRKGIYLTHVVPTQPTDVNGEGLTTFNLLRCSTNLDGPTDNLKDVDHEIVDKANEVCDLVVQGHASLNHVLAQVYENTTQTNEKDVIKEKKAKIKAHSDKTKDMPRNGLIAFATFYSNDLCTKAKPSQDDMFDYVYKTESVLTKLRFKLKECVNKRPDLLTEFSVKLYNNSLFIIPLSTNALYTHEIVPSVLPSDKIPTRLGYVIRCSKTQAIHQSGETYICQDDGIYVKLMPPSDKDRLQLKDLYLKENTTDEHVPYGQIYYSMNTGDYKKPQM